VAPVLVYPHHETFGDAAGYGISVTGGHVYRGKALPALDGSYLFADWATSWAAQKYGLFAGVRDDTGKWTMHILPGAKSPEGGDQMVVGFGYDHDGEIYVLTNAGRGPAGKTGKVWKIVPGK
jgi:glucose/arabinose dehydrogenase